MENIFDMIERLCPDGVEYVKIGDICHILRGNRLTKKELVPNGEFPVVHGGTTPMGYYNKYNRKSCTTVVVNTGNAGYVFWQDKKFWSSDACFSLYPEENLLDKFLYYFLSSREDILKSRIRSGAMPTIDSNAVADILIPVPPVEVQRETIRILDEYSEKVTALNHELEKELELRKKQYSYYRDKLLNFGNDIECKPLGELFKIKNGLNKEKSAFGKGKPIINFTDVYKNRWLAKDSFSGLVDVTPNEIKRYSAKKGDVFFTRTSETKEDIGMSSTLIDDVPDCVFSGFVLRARPTTTLLIPKFCAYYFSTYNVRKKIIKNASFTTRATTTGEKLSKINIPIPPIEEQEKIIKILDKFDTLCNDLTSGIPAEISARKKQYEYYRDKIFDFKRR
ncbi:MAG: restriction endonuclease subunit S [Ruminococcus sp.]|nr:restriction endonuclease subunit S [Ruminococcus sp.]